jgi:hypothetical protein
MDKVPEWQTEGVLVVVEMECHPRQVFVCAAVDPPKNESGGTTDAMLSVNKSFRSESVSIGNDTLITVKTFSHSELEICRRSNLVDFAYAVIVLECRNDVIFSKFE